MGNAWFSASRIPGRLRAENGCIRSETEVDYLQLSCEAMERVKRLTSPELSRSLHLNQALCRLLADALSDAVQSAKQDIHGLDPSSVRLCAPALRELCRVAGDCEKLVRDCCNENWLAVAILLADSRQDFSLRVSELKWCTRAWRSIIAHGLQGGAWLKQFHRSSQISAADRGTDMGDETARLKIAFGEDLKTLRSKLGEMQGDVDVEEEVRELAGYVLSRCEMIGAGRRDSMQERSKYELPGRNTATKVKSVLGRGGFGTVLQISWFQEDVAAKVISEKYVRNYADFDKEVTAMTRTSGHPRLVRLLGVLLSYPDSGSNAIVMERMSKDLSQLMEQRKGERGSGSSTGDNPGWLTGSIPAELGTADFELMSSGFRECTKQRQARGGRSSAGDGPFPLHVAVDIMLQVAEGVEVLHKQRLFHRDLKSMNVLVEPVEVQALRDEGYVLVKLADFGLTETRSRTFGLQRAGTMRWIAPEIGSGSNDTLVYPAKADTFSFAVLCFEILSGELPFTDKTRSTLQEHVLEGLRPELPAALPSQLASLVRRCWDKEPSNRPSFAAICKELRYLKFLITIGGEMQFRGLDVPDEDEAMSAEIVKQLRWIEEDELRLVGHLGSGGFGSVDECVWRGQRVAVKNLWRVEKGDVEKEAALLVRVEHPNVVKLIGCGFNEVEERGLIVMELMDQDLQHLIRGNMRVRSPNEPPFSLPVALTMMLKVAEAMEHIRKCNVLHRDLKTSNILVKFPGTGSECCSSPVRMGGVGSASEETCYDVRLADFGLSKYKSKGSRFTTRASEAQHWRAPETAEGGNYSWPADVFSFGVVCYEILSGEVPFKGMAGAGLLKLVRDGKRPEIPTYCPKSVAELVGACWATNPEGRPEFAEICLKLEACLNVEHSSRSAAIHKGGTMSSE